MHHYCFNCKLIYPTSPLMSEYSLNLRCLHRLRFTPIPHINYSRHFFLHNKLCILYSQSKMKFQLNEPMRWHLQVFWCLSRNCMILIETTIWWKYMTNIFARLTNCVRHLYWKYSCKYWIKSINVVRYAHNLSTFMKMYRMLGDPNIGHVAGIYFWRGELCGCWCNVCKMYMRVAGER